MLHPFRSSETCGQLSFAAACPPSRCVLPSIGRRRPVARRMCSDTESTGSPYRTLLSLSFVAHRARLTYQWIFTSPSRYFCILSNGKGASLTGTERYPMTSVVFGSVEQVRFHDQSTRFGRKGDNSVILRGSSSRRTFVDAALG